MIRLQAVYGGIAAVAAAGLLYGSTVPFAFAANPRWRQEWRGLWPPHLGTGSVSDTVVNVGCGLVVTFFGLMALGRPLSVRRGLFHLATVGLAQLLWSVGCETLQIWCRDRVPSAGDVGAQLAGAGLAAVCWLTLAISWPTAWTRSPRPLGLTGGHLGLAAAAVTAYQLLPWLPLTSPAEVWHRYRAGGMEIWPDLWAAALPDRLYQILRQTTLYAGLGWLAARPVRSAHARRLYALPAAVELAQVFFRYCRPSILDALVGTAAVWGGGLLFRQTRATSRSSRRSALRRTVAVAAALSAAVLVQFWYPFRLTPIVAWGRELRDPMAWIPGAGLHRGNIGDAWRTLERSVLLFAPLGWLLGRMEILHRPPAPSSIAVPRWRASWLALAITAIAVLHLGKFLLVGRTGSTAALLLATTAFVLARRLAVGGHSRDGQLGP